MNMSSGERIRKVAIAGAGPAGSSLAIRLALRGLEVTLIEREHFPRHKLCGEFISPEALLHFEDLEVLDEMLASGGDRVRETRFSDRRGRSFTLPSSMMDGGGFALSLSRSKMDDILLSRAAAAGAEVLTDTRISGVETNGLFVGSFTAVHGQASKTITADLFVDATGRGASLSKLAVRSTGTRVPPPRPSRSVAFKTHLRGSGSDPGVCEIFAFPGGYGGLSHVEDGLANLCFIVNADCARKFGGPGAILGGAIFQNPLASALLNGSEQASEWLAVSINSFGRKEPPPFSNLVSVGDSAAFIDPFTGSGMLMALESSALLADVTADGRLSVTELRERYRVEHSRIFTRRLRVSSVLRHAAFMPVMPSLLVGALKLSGRARKLTAEALRPAKLAPRKNS
jgi:menaquinone-9 beta-reductase